MIERAECGGEVQNYIFFSAPDVGADGYVSYTISDTAVYFSFPPGRKAHAFNDRHEIGYRLQHHLIIESFGTSLEKLVFMPIFCKISSGT